MENQQSSSLFGLNLDENLKQSLKATASIAGVAAIFGLVSTIVKSISAVMVKKTTQTYNFGSGTMESTRASNSGGILGMIIALAIGISLFYYLNRFSKSTAAGVDGTNLGTINEGFSGLATYFKIIGVIMIIVIAFALLAILIGIGNN